MQYLLDSLYSTPIFPKENQTKSRDNVNKWNNLKNVCILKTLFNLKKIVGETRCCTENMPRAVAYFPHSLSRLKCWQSWILGKMFSQLVLLSSHFLKNL